MTISLKIFFPESQFFAQEGSLQSSRGPPFAWSASDASGAICCLPGDGWSAAGPRSEHTEARNGCGDESSGGCERSDPLERTGEGCANSPLDAVADRRARPGAEEVEKRPARRALLGMCRGLAGKRRASAQLRIIQVAIELLAACHRPDRSRRRQPKLTKSADPGKGRQPCRRAAPAAARR